MAGGLQRELGKDIFGCVARQPQQRGDVTLSYRAEAIAAAGIEEGPFFRRELLDGVKNLLGRQGVDLAIKAGDGCCGHTQLGFGVNAGAVDEVVERVAQQDVCVKAKLGAHGISLSTGLRSGKWFESQYKMRCTKRLAWVCRRESSPIFQLRSNSRVNQRKSAVILGAQWGDEGKGKIVDVLSEKFNVVARYAGGHNAGHTVIIAGKKFILQLIPCGVLRPECKGVIGNGVVLDPMAFLSEVKKLKDAGLPITGGPNGQLFVSNRAQVILPYHRMIELAAENAPGRTKIGTTSRGSRPAYEDKMHRSGLRVVDLLNPALLRTHINNACYEKNTIAQALFGTEPLDPKAIYEEYARAAEQIAPFVTDTAVLLNQAIRAGEKVMFEGAQGALLDIDHGTYPFVTSSSSTAGGAVTGTGVGPTK